MTDIAAGKQDFLQYPLRDGGKIHAQQCPFFYAAEVVAIGFACDQKTQGSFNGAFAMIFVLHAIAHGRKLVHFDVLPLAARAGARIIEK